jgi:hypothetical protein
MHSLNRTADPARSRTVRNAASSLLKLFQGKPIRSLRAGNMKRLIKESIKKLPYLKRVFIDRDRLRAERDELRAKMELLWAPPGHYCSPIPSIDEIRVRETEIFDDIPRELPEVCLNEEEQLALLQKFKEYYRDMPFEAQKKEGVRYFFENPSFGYADAIVLFCMIRHVQPRRIIEVGSGYSSCVILDTNELFFDNAISCTFIEPYPELFESLIDERDKSRIELVRKKLQEVDSSRFTALSAGDILFIDSSHVSKIDSDVNYVFFKILPLLKSGVHIHFHDIIYPFEYPKEWVYQGIAWNEAYLLRAFLQNNSAFKVKFFNSFLSLFHREEFSDAMPLGMKNTGGSIWITRV